MDFVEGRFVKWLGVMAVDPGGTTGVAWGVFPTEHAVDTRCELARDLGSGEVTGDYQYQAARIVEHWREFSAWCEGQGVGARLVVEDFVLRVRSASSDRAQLMPVRVAACIEGILIESTLGCAMPLGRVGWEAMLAVYDDVVYQTAAAAKGYATDARLRRWGFWVRGSRHCRDAWRHVLLYVAENAC